MIKDREFNAANLAHVRGLVAELVTTLGPLAVDAPGLFGALHSSSLCMLTTADVLASAVGETTDV